ncbi:MAG: hypothetical protein JXR71_07595 [Bacteroidales bacterium]|nr:hypothetical protein [Bacteroidales bacterium]
MNNTVRYQLYALILMVMFPLISLGQTLPVGTPVLSDYYRRAQLLGKLNPEVSFTSFPLFPVGAFKVQNAFDPDSTLYKNRLIDFDGMAPFLNKKGRVQLLPVVWKNQYNSQHPAGMNDGVMVPARGYQTVLSAGVFIKFGPLSVQLNPEWHYAANVPFQGFYQIYGKPSPPSGLIDLPERFGDSAIQQVSWGQSSIRLTFGPVSFGFSNENLWWGPGIHNALLMTNNAPGFPHLTLNTVRPIKTPIGSFEGQLIGGKLVGSGYTPGLPDDWRYLNSLTLTYQPKWVPGLFLGFARSFQIYHSDMGNHLYDYLPVFGAIEKVAVGNAATDVRRQDQLLSIFMRWVWVKARGEFYAEFGREDHAWNTRDLLLEPNHSAAYVVGLMKLFPLWRKNEYIQINAEVTNLASTATTNNRVRDYTPPVGYWYTHYQIKQGYTNDGQVLGAGIGPGSNMQWLRVSWVKGMKSLGLDFERYVHDNDYLIANIKDIRRNWVDLSTGLVGSWAYKNLLFSAEVKYIHEINYEWRYRPVQITNAKPTYWSPTKDSYNFHALVNVVYRF